MQRITGSEIPQTVQEKILPPQVRPAIPIESGSSEIPADLTVGESVSDFAVIYLPRAQAVEEESFSFPLLFTMTLFSRWVDLRPFKKI